MKITINGTDVDIFELAGNMVLIEEAFRTGAMEKHFIKNGNYYSMIESDEVFSTDYDDSEFDFGSLYITYSPEEALSFYEDAGFITIDPEECRLALSDEGLFQLSTVYDEEVLMMCIIYATLEKANCKKFYFDLDYYTKVMIILDSLGE